MMAHVDPRRTFWKVALVVTLLVTTSIALGAGAVGDSAGTDPHSDTLLVTLRDGADPHAIALDHGLTLTAHHATLGVAVFEGHAVKHLARDARVSAVDTDGRTRLADTGADGVTWNDATWDGVTWNGVTWNGVTWNDASTDGVTWNGVTWNGVTWNDASTDGVTWNDASTDGVTWNGVTWNGATWNGITWNGVTWNGVTWNAEDGSASAVPPWGVLAIGAPWAWQAGTPEHNRIVCTVDSGVDAAHPYLRANLWRGPHGTAGWDFVEDDAVPQDEGGHGTHMAGIIAGARVDGMRFAGVGAPLVAAARVIDGSGTGTTSDAIAGIAWCADIGADVILLAFTEDAPTHAFRKAVLEAQREGALIVASAGNTGPCERCVSTPGAYARVLAVGAVAPDGALAPFSATGNEVSLVAPGVAIVSTSPQGMRVASGTSQAAAFTAGAAALVWGHVPDWPAERVAQHLQQTAQPYGAPGRDAQSGAGMLDVASAVAALPSN